MRCGLEVVNSPALFFSKQFEFLAPIYFSSLWLYEGHVNRIRDSRLVYVNTTIKLLISGKHFRCVEPVTQRLVDIVK